MTFEYNSGAQQPIGSTPNTTNTGVAPTMTSPLTTIQSAIGAPPPQNMPQPMSFNSGMMPPNFQQFDPSLFSQIGAQQALDSSMLGNPSQVYNPFMQKPNVSSPFGPGTMVSMDINKFGNQSQVYDPFNGQTPTLDEYMHNWSARAGLYESPEAYEAARQAAMNQYNQMYGGTTSPVNPQMTTSPVNPFMPPSSPNPSYFYDAFNGQTPTDRDTPYMPMLTPMPMPYNPYVTQPRTLPPIRPLPMPPTPLVQPRQPVAPTPSPLNQIRKDAGDFNKQQRPMRPMKQQPRRGIM